MQLQTDTVYRQELTFINTLYFVCDTQAGHGYLHACMQIDHTVTSLQYSLASHTLSAKGVACESTYSSDVGPYPHAAGNLYVILYWIACPREHAFRRCSFRGWRFKYNTRKCTLSNVEVLNLSELSDLSDFQPLLR